MTWREGAWLTLKLMISDVTALQILQSHFSARDQTNLTFLVVVGCQRNRRLLSCNVAQPLADMVEEVPRAL
jgi:hypothetical protein